MANKKLEEKVSDILKEDIILDTETVEVITE